MSPNILEDPKAWSKNTLVELNRGLYERDHIISSSLLAVLSGQSVFLYGPPGTAKSLIARRLSCVFSESVYFEYLMQRFSTPEEVFGPISISELKKDNYHRLTENYLPSADIAFLDEIWKSSPAILNTLLTIVNERKFRNGTAISEVPLKAIIAASNEFPQANSGLDALYDRFILRLAVNPMLDEASFRGYITGGDTESVCEIGTQVTVPEWGEVRSKAESLPLQDTTLDILAAIRRRMGAASSPLVYVSDRRWRKAISILRMAAYLSGYDSVKPHLVFLLKDCFWSTLSDRKTVSDIVDASVREVLAPFAGFLSGWESDAALLASEIREVFKKVPRKTQEPVVINGIGCYEVSVDVSGRTERYYFPYGPKNVGGIYTAFCNGSSIQFQVLSVNENEASVRFLGGSKATCTIPVSIGSEDTVPESTVRTYLRSLDELSGNLDVFISRVGKTLAEREFEDDSIFIDPSDTKALHSVISSYVDEASAKKSTISELRRIIDDYGN